MDKIRELQDLDNKLSLFLQQEKLKKANTEDRVLLVQTVGEELKNLITPVLEALDSNTQSTGAENKAVVASIESLVSKMVEVANKNEGSNKELLDAIQAIQVKVPEIKIPEVKVTIPEIKVPEARVTVEQKEIKIPTIKVPKPEVTVNVPAFPKIPKLEWPKGKMPVEGNVNLEGVNLANPLPVQLRDADGKPVTIPVGGVGFGGGKTDHFTIKSIEGVVDTELPAASALADATANPTAPAVAAHVMGFNGTTWDRPLNFTLVDANTGAGTVLVPQINLIQRSASGPTEIGISTNPLYADPTTNETIAEGASVAYTNSEAKNVLYNLPLLYNDTGGSNTWYRWASASAPAAGGFAFPFVNSAKVSPLFTRDDTATDTVTEGYWHYPRITEYRAIHLNKRDSAGNELLESADVTHLASASRTTTQTGADTVNYPGYKYLTVVLDMTVVAAGPSVTLTIQGKDVASGAYYTILTGAAVTTASTNVYRVGPGHTPAANATTDYTLPRTWRILITANNANAGTYSVGYSLTK